MTGFAGIRGTGNWGAGEQPTNFREMILRLEPNGVTPLFALSNFMQSESVDDQTFTWFEEESDIIRLHVDGQVLVAGTSLVVDAEGVDANARLGGKHVKAGDLFRVEDASEAAAYTGVEIFSVDSVSADGLTLTITRGVAGSTAVQIEDNEYVTWIGNAFEEGSSKGALTSKNPDPVTNYCQIWKNGFGITKSADKTFTRTSNGFQADKQRKMFLHHAAIEMAILYGKAYKDTSGTEDKFFTGGLSHFLTTNRTIGGTTTLKILTEYFEQLFDFSAPGIGDERLCFCGNGFRMRVNQLIDGGGSGQNFQYNGELDLWGMKLKRLSTPSGDIALKVHPLMSRHPLYKYSAFFVTPKGLKWRYMRDTMVEKNIQLPGDDKMEDQFITEGGFEIHHERTMGYFGNLII